MCMVKIKKGKAVEFSLVLVEQISQLASNGHMVTHIFFPTHA